MEKFAKDYADKFMAGLIAEIRANLSFIRL